MWIGINFNLYKIYSNLIHSNLEGSVQRTSPNGPCVQLKTSGRGREEGGGQLLHGGGAK
jgi:hypothetical protein